jgi:DNA-binding NtrC family response regulator
MQDVLRIIERVAPTDSSVLILGESGTGKELVARAIHEHSLRAERPFVPIHCGALPREVLESELFGHEKGAFTGAVAAKPGLVELADGGTLLLDEIGEMEPDSQVKLLRALETGTFFRVGGTRPRRVDVRIVAATNRDLKRAVAEERFREDLYYRLNVIPITLPPLRDRREDLPLLVDHFLQELSVSLNRRIDGLSADAMKLLVSHDWPGNVRELRNMVERLVIMTAGQTIEPADLPPPLQLGEPGGPRAPVGQSLREARDAFERAYILGELRAHEGNITQTAKALGIGRVHLWRKLKAYGITPPRRSEEASHPDA